MKKDEFMEILEDETLDTVAEWKNQIDGESDREGIISAIAVSMRIPAIATVKAMEIAGFISFEDTGQE